MRTPLQKGEKILLVTYTSWVSLIGPTFGSLIFIATGIWLSAQYGGYWWLISVVAIIYFLIKYFEWKVNIWVVTTSRVIDESGLLRHFAKESPLEKINNVSYDQSVWGRLLNFGNVEIQTAAEAGATSYFNVNHPKRLKDTITQAQSDFENHRAVNQATQMATALGVRGNSSQNISAELEKLYELKQKGILSDDEYTKAKNKLLNN
ncbi:MAG TPA: PH domain-containing protein [Puia sp.]|jgi:membrane protein YdbS with pleckstrin-like domain|nr:PH domain-containing protein [Puia sp.]